MRRTWPLIPALLLMSAPVLGQPAPADAGTMQSILDELRQLRVDLKVTITQAQRAQVLLYRLQAQEAAVARSSQRLDDARTKYMGALSQRKSADADIKRQEAFVANTDNPADERKMLQATIIPQLKSKMESFGVEEQQTEVTLADAQGQLLRDQGKLTELQAQLDELQKDLERSEQTAIASR